MPCVLSTRKVRGNRDQNKVEIVQTGSTALTHVHAFYGASILGLAGPAAQFWRFLCFNTPTKASFMV